MASQVDALALHLVFRAAVRTFIKYALQTVSTIRYINGDFIIPLPCKVIKGKGFFQHCIQFRNGLGLELLRRYHALYMGADLDITHLKHIVHGVSVECTLSDNRHHGHAQALHHNAHSLGQGGGAAIKGVACLRIHDNAGFVHLEHMFKVSKQGHIRHKFMGGCAAQQAHKLTQNAGHGIHRGDKAHLAGIKDAVGKLHIRKAGMIHQNQAGLVLHQFHALGGIAKAGFPQRRLTGDAGNGGQPLLGHHGLFVLKPGQFQHFLIGHLFYIYFHC